MKGKTIIAPIGQKIAQILAGEISIPASQTDTQTRIMHAGLNSLVLLRMKAKLEKIVGPIILSFFFEARTIGNLASMLGDVATLTKLRKEYNPIVTLCKEGDKTPIFLVPPETGEIMNWINIVQYISDTPLHAIRMRGVSPNEDMFASMTDLLDCYEAAILRVQPHGPYAILGLSWDTYITFELAKRLKARGAVVAFCGGIDQPPSAVIIAASQSFPGFCGRILASVGVRSPQSAIGLEERYRHVEISQEAFFEILAQEFGNAKLEGAGVTAEMLQAWARVFSDTSDMARAYVCEGKIDNFICFCVPWVEDLSLKEWDEMNHEWDGVAEKISYFRVQGTHFTILNQPYIEVFQAELKRALIIAGI